MARIPDAEIERLKLQVSVVRLVEAAGIALKAHGKDLVGRCPWHDDKTPSLVVSPKTNLWHCMGACQTGGSSIDWVMKFESVSFRRAVELLRQETGTAPVVAIVPASDVNAAHDAALAVEQNDAALLSRVIDYYHATLRQSSEALAYLTKRGLTHPELVDHFKLGFANRTLAYRLPPRQRVARDRIQSQLERIGIYRASGHEHLNGSLIVPVFDGVGEVAEVYGRKITPNLREGTPLHLYLPGPHRGVFNEQGLAGQEEVILCEALIDALTFWCAGYRNVTSSFGIEGFTDDHLAAFKRHSIKRILIAYDADDAGNAAAEKLTKKLITEGLDCYRCRFPKGMDANEYALSVQPAAKSLGLVIRQAEWLGNGAAPSRAQVLSTAVPDAVLPPPSMESSLVAEEAAEEETENSNLPIEQTPVLPEPPAYRVPPAPDGPHATISESGELSLVLGDRTYRVRAIEKNLSYDQLKVWLRATCGEFFHLDTVDLAQAKQRAAWCKAAATELGVSEEIAKADLGKLLRAVEERQDALIREQLSPAALRETAKPLDPQAQSAALTFLQSSDLIERIVADFERAGLVGEPTNALVGYLAAVSRKLPTPLAILIQSTSAAGKSALMDAVLRFVPEVDRVHYSAMTGQSLFYLGEGDLKHKILAIAEEEGVRQAAYALKLLQSQGELTIASTGKDPTTGKLITEEYRVEGPVMLFLTTTAIDVDEELLNRCLVLTINEGREQTRAIQQRQRARRTLAGLLGDSEADAVATLHQNAQQLLRPVSVVNPFADQLGFLDDRTRTRRDHQKYLTLIDAIAFLHQHQRELNVIEHRGKRIEYVEVTAADIALANRLAHEVLGRSLDELPPQTRRLLGVVRGFVAERCAALAVRQVDLRFTRRELRERAGLSEAQLRLHLDRLVELEYLLPHRGQRGQSFVYELVFDGAIGDSAPHLPGLLEVEVTVTTTSSRGELTQFVGSSRPHRGVFVAGSLGQQTPVEPSADAVLLPLVAASSETAVPRKRANGSHRSVTVS